MVEDRVERRHAAILAAAIAGCSWLMGEDEEGMAEPNGGPNGRTMFSLRFGSN